MINKQNIQLKMNMSQTQSKTIFKNFNNKMNKKSLFKSKTLISKILLKTILIFRNTYNN